MSLEDELLRALYACESAVASDELAYELGISENALCSIVNRIKMNHPHFIITETKGHQNNKLSLHPNKIIEGEVQLFLAEGGFTAINEKELMEYEQALLVMEAEKHQPGNRNANGHLLKKAVTWMAGMAVTAGAFFLSFKFNRKPKIK
jgi:hypothetical protein